MKSYGMNQKLIRLITAIYSETQLAVIVNGHLSEWFQMTVLVIDKDDEAKLFKHVRSADDSAVLQKNVIDCFSGQISGC